MYHFILYYCGNGVNVGSYGTCAVDYQGDLIPLEWYAQKLAELPNIMGLIFLDCGRETSHLQPKPEIFHIERDMPADDQKVP